MKKTTIKIRFDIPRLQGETGEIETLSEVSQEEREIWLTEIAKTASRYPSILEPDTIEISIFETEKNGDITRYTIECEKENNYEPKIAHILSLFDCPVTGFIETTYEKTTSKEGEKP